MGSCSTKIPKETNYILTTGQIPTKPQREVGGEVKLYIFGDQCSDHTFYTQIPMLGIPGNITGLEHKHNTYFYSNNIAISKICASSYTDNIFWITKHRELYGSDSNARKPIHIKQLTNVIDVACGHDYHIAVCGSRSLIMEMTTIKYIISFWSKLDVPNDIAIIIGQYHIHCNIKLYSMGLNNYCQLGHGREYGLNLMNWRPIKSFNDTSFASVACGEAHTLLLDTDGRIYSCGNNDYAQLGLGHNATKPTLLPYFTIYMRGIVVTKICAGYRHNLCLDSDGKIYSWGDNVYGQSGLEIDEMMIYKPQMVELLTDCIIIDIKTGVYGSYARSDKNYNFLWGNNNYGQSTLKKMDNLIQTVPFLINDIFYQYTLGKIIKDVYLGFDTTYIVGIEQ